MLLLLILGLITYDQTAPANTAIEYDSQTYTPNLLGEPEYFGVPSTELDKRWNHLLERESQSIVCSDKGSGLIMLCSIDDSADRG